MRDGPEPEGVFRDAPAAERPIYVLRLRPEPGVDAIRMLRWFLKSMLRRYGLRCLSIDEERRP